MANPIETLRKLKGRSLQEIRVRGEQALAARTERLGLSGGLPLDEEFAQFFDKAAFGANGFSPENLRAKFFEQSEAGFFQSFADAEKTFEIFRASFGETASATVERAEKIIENRFDLLGYKNLDFGAPVDWHFDPTTNTRAPLKHWKQFDEMATDETGDKKIVWELNRHQYFFDLGAAYRLTNDERFAETFAAHLADWIEKNPPGSGVNWMSSLEVALRSISWIWAFHFFKDSPALSPELFRDAARYLFLHARHIEKYLSTYYSPNTHLTGEALGLYYIGTQFPFFERAAHWRKTGEEILLAELDRQFLPDGVYFEQTTWYQRYTTDFYAHFFILKRLNDHEELPEKLVEKLQSSLDFLMFITRPDGTTPLVGDDDGGRILPLGDVRNEPSDFRAVLSTGAALFKRGDYKFVAENLAPETLWLLGSESVETFENLEAEPPAKTSAAFTGGGYFVMRDGWTETDNYLLIDCGDLGSLAAGHGHADALAVNLSVAGKRTLVDAGTYSYHESEEIRNRFRSTEAHNTLTIDGKSQSEPGAKFGWQTKANAQLKNWISQDRFDFFEGAHDGYERFDAEAKSVHTRSVLFLKNDYWIFRDFVETRGAHEYALNFQFDAATKPSIERLENGASCVNEKPENSAVGLRLFTFGDNGEWQNEQSEISPIFGKKVSAPRLKFVSEGVGSQEFFTFLLPSEIGFAAPEVYETEIAGGRAFVVAYRDYKDVFVFTDGETVRTELFNTNFRFLWSRVAAGDEQPEEFVLIDGTHFSIGGLEVVNQTEPLRYATARRFGNSLNVRAPESVFSVSLPQKKKATTYVLKNSA